MKQQKGTDTVPFFFFIMANEELIQTVETLVSQLLEAEPADFLVSIKVKPTNNIKVFIDSDNGLSIEKCIKYNRALYHAIEEGGQFPEGDFSLEVSSPGIDEPLKMLRQYNKNIGRKVEITKTDLSVLEGKLLEVSEEEIIIETTEGKGKKAETKQIAVPFESIKSTIVQIQF